MIGSFGKSKLKFALEIPPSDSRIIRNSDRGFRLLPLFLIIHR